MALTPIVECQTHDMVIEVVPYRSEWAAQFDVVRQELQAALAGVPGVRIEHVGSTAVPGLAAKPILDVDVLVHEDHIPPAIDALARAGYRHRGDLGVSGREAFHAPDDDPRRHVYLSTPDNLHVRNHLAVRAVLGARPDLRDEYGEVKLALAADPGIDIDRYLAGKSAVLQTILAAADLSAAERQEILRLNDPGLRPATRESLAAELVTLGLHPGDLVMVHASLRSLGPVKGGAAAVVAAILDALGPAGTLSAYVDYEPFHEDDDPEPPVFDKQTARAAIDHGVLAETIRTWPAAVRSDHPGAGVSAIGARAEWLTRDHPFNYGYGAGSPLARLVEAEGKVLLLGSPLDRITLLHYAEDRAQLTGKRVVTYRVLMPGADGTPEWADFEEFDTSLPCVDGMPENLFQQIAEAALAAGIGVRGRIARADAVLFEARPLTEFAISWLEARWG